MLALMPAISLAALDADALLKSLARPAPAVTPFVEVRYSKLLEQPIVVKGQLEYHEDGTLVRAVQDPFQERTEIKGETVTIARVGKSPRTFSLEHAPELRSMLGGFAAVLGGARTDLEQDFSLAVSGELPAWQVSLTPKSQQLGKYVHDIVIHGAANDPHCIIMTQPDAGASVMLVGRTAESKLPSPLARELLAALCTKG
jgi:hypothetical protein